MYAFDNHLPCLLVHANNDNNNLHQTKQQQ